MEFRDPINDHHPLHLNQAPPPPHQNYQPPPILSHPSSSSSFSFIPNPNPNPNPNSTHSFENPLPYHRTAAADTLRPPGVDPYPYSNPNPYNLTRSFENRLLYPPAAAATTSDTLRAPGVDPYPYSNPNPYNSIRSFENPLPYHPTAADTLRPPRVDLYPYSNPNPYNLIRSFENPLPYHPTAAAADALRPPGVDPYPYSNPNQYNSIRSFENPLPYHPAAAGTLQPPGVDPYHYSNPNPYASHLPLGGPHSIMAQSYQQEASDYHHQFHQLQYAVDSSTAKVGSGNTIADLEIKKLRVLQCGAPADSVRICSICNVVCNSDKVFASHLSGEKHKLKALGLPFDGLKLKVPAHTKALHFTKKAKPAGPKTNAKKAKPPGPKTNAKKVALKALSSFAGSSVCDVCKIDCNSQEVLNNHKLGKKHIANLQKLQESIKPKPKPEIDSTKNSIPKANPSTSRSKKANEQTKQNAAPATKDREKKKRKVFSGGATADAVRVCTQCNVVCNSQEVYNSHIVGKKHVAMINKRRAAPVS